MLRNNFCVLRAQTFGRGIKSRVICFLLSLNISVNTEYSQVVVNGFFFWKVAEFDKKKNE